MIQCHQTKLPYTFFSIKTLYTLFKGSPFKCKSLRFSSAQVKICLISHVNFELISHTFSTFDKSMPSRSQFGDLQVLRWTFAKFLMSIFGNTSQFSFKLCFNLECNQTCTFLAQILYNLVKISTLKCRFLRLSSSEIKIPKLLMSILKRQ